MSAGSADVPGQEHGSDDVPEGIAQTRTLVVTNDFPPRPGGIQAFVHSLLLNQPDPASVLVYAPKWSGDAAFDAEQPFEVVRHRTSLMLPEPLVAHRAAELARSHGATSVLYGAAAPLGLLAGRLRKVGVEHQVGLTHGHEAAWAQIPGARQVLRRIGSNLDTVTYLGEYTRSRIAAALTPQAASRMRQLAPGVDAAVFSPDRRGEGMRIRAELGWSERPVIVCVSRLMPRKGQDTLIEAMPLIQRKVPDVALLIVGGGPYRDSLESMVGQAGLGKDVHLTGSVPWESLPAHYAAGDVFAMPCRTRHRGIDVEGLGIVFLEASATGLPVIAGDSGGAPDAVLEGQTGYVVPGGDAAAVAERAVELLLDPELRTVMGERGRAWVETDWSSAVAGLRLASLLAGQDPDAA